jgi:hypothetical protein
MLKGGLVKRLKPSDESARKRLKKAEKWLGLSHSLIELDVDTAMEKLYDSILEAGMAIMAKQGYRPTSKNGHHFAVMEYLSNAVDADSSELHTIRKSRNIIIYEDEEDAITIDYFDEVAALAKEIMEKTEKLIK